MALPVGVTTATITFGVPVSFTGGAVRSTVSIVPSASLVHTATGTPLVNFIEDVITSEGVSGQFTLPHTDQLGFQDESGNSYQNWYYTATISYSAGKTTLPPRTKTFQLPTGQTTVDLDLLPAGAPVLPWTAATANVTSFHGRIGAVTVQESDLPTRLSATSLNATYAPVTGSATYATKADSVPRWKASTAYLAGEAVLSPAGDIVTAKTGFTSTGTYDAANWNVPPAISNAVGADPWHYGASATADSAAAFNAAIVVSKVINLRPGQRYRLNTSVSLPAGTIIEGNGAELQYLTQAALVCNDDVIIRNVKFVNGNTAGFIGGERFVTVQAPRVTIEGCSFTGQGYRHGIVVEKSGGGNCDHCTIRHCYFTDVSYGILKQGGPPATPTTAHFMKVINNRFTLVRRGDAIGLNAGSDYGVLVDSNVIDDVADGSIAYAGFGIAVAGLTGYAAVESDRFRRCIISNNTITNTIKEAIHVEVASRVDVRGNHLEQVAVGKTGTATGISVYGSINCTVEDNSVFQYDTGILDGIGFLAGNNIISTDRNLIQGNRVTGCTLGIVEGVGGQGKSSFVRGNTLTGCPTGIKHFACGSLSVYIGNVLQDCPIPFNIDANPAAKAAVAATTRAIVLKDNMAYTIDGGAAPVNTYTNTAGTTFSGDGNTFSLPA